MRRPWWKKLAYDVGVWILAILILAIILGAFTWLYADFMAQPCDAYRNISAARTPARCIGRIP